MSKLSEIREITADVFGVSPDDLKGYPRTSKLVTARRAFIKIARDQKKFSLPQIGRAIKRDHTTVLHHLRMVERGKLDQHKDQLEKICQRLRPPYLRSGTAFQFKSVRTSP